MFQHFLLLGYKKKEFIKYKFVFYTLRVQFLSSSLWTVLKVHQSEEVKAKKYDFPSTVHSVISYWIIF